MARHILKDVLRPGLDIVFCGTAPGFESAAQRAYYAFGGNKFWPTLHITGLTPHRMAPADFETLLNFKIGLTDLAKFEYGNDDDLGRDALRGTALKRLRRQILKYQPKILAFTSKTGGEAFLGRACALGPQPEMVGATRIWILPSPSGRAARFWNVAIWHALAQEIRQNQPSFDGRALSR